jgi:hypothetical protein
MVTIVEMFMPQANINLECLRTVDLGPTRALARLTRVAKVLHQIRVTHLIQHLFVRRQARYTSQDFIQAFELHLVHTVELITNLQNVGLRGQ